MRKLSSRKLFFVAVLSMVLVICLCSFFVPTTNYVNAEENSPQKAGFFPQQNIETKQLSKPIDAIVYDDVTAIIDGDSNVQKLYVYNPSTSTYTDISGSSLKQVKRLSEDKLIYSDSGKIKTLDIRNPSASPTILGGDIGGNFFDLNSNTFAISYSNTINLFDINDGVIAEQKRGYTFTITSETPVAINDKNELFYVPLLEKNETTYKIEKVTLPNITPITIASGLASIPTAFCVDNNNLYYATRNSIFNVNLETNTQINLALTPDENFDLGNLVVPNSLFIKEDKLIISDSYIGAVQEFAVENNNLEFTGFAIAKGKTAFNRIDNRVSDSPEDSTIAFDVERNKDTLAVLSTNRLMLINNDANFDYYNKDCYTNLFARDFSSKEFPTEMALGDNHMLLATDKTLLLLSLTQKGKEFSEQFSITSGGIADLCYQNDTYYVLVNYDDLTSSVFKFTAQDILSKNFNLNDFKCSDKEYLNDSKVQTTIGVNVFGTILTRDDCTKITSDLVGNFYILKDDKIEKHAIGTDTTSSIYVHGITSFEIDFDKKACYILKKDSEQLYPIYTLSNESIDTLSIPKDFKTTSTSTEGDLNVFTAENTNVYSVDIVDNKFSFKQISKIEKHYILLSTLPEQNLKILACQEGIVLINDDGLQSTQIPTTEFDTTAYVSTDVNAYYLPIITIEDSFVLYNQEFNNIRLSKGTRFNAIKIVEFLDIEYYLATFTVKGVQYKGYIPVNFTTLQPISISKYTTYFYDHSEDTTIYLNQNLTEAVATLKKGETIKVFTIENDVAKIQYLDGEVWKDGFIDADAIHKPNKTIKNVIIILVTLACAFGTLTYFVLRKNRTN